MESILATAITNRQRMQIWYDPGLRIIEPHTYGINIHDNELLRAYQLSGASKSGEQPHWKLFRVDRIGEVTLLPENFDSPRDGYEQGDSAMNQHIFAEL